MLTEDLIRLLTELKEELAAQQIDWEVVIETLPPNAIRRKCLLNMDRLARWQPRIRQALDAAKKTGS